MSTEPQKAEVPVEEEKMLCPCCFYQNIPEVAFCKDCGAPLGSSVCLDPIRQIQALGFFYRRATGGPPSWKVVLGVWIIYFPLFAYSMISLGAWLGQHRHNPVELLPVLWSGLYTGTFLYQASVNYARKVNPMKPEPPTAGLVSPPKAPPKKRWKDDWGEWHDD